MEAAVAVVVVVVAVEVRSSVVCVKGTIILHPYFLVIFLFFHLCKNVAYNSRKAKYVIDPLKAPITEILLSSPGHRRLRSSPANRPTKRQVHTRNGAESQARNAPTESRT